ncbi:hypothetical protein ACN9MN_05595 [Chryseobacterium sp. S-02]|uniref:hypothetical protein n=1 Tax=Chryseobacterium sp. S-02 TaxID=3404064 RepID=UPI003CEEE18D
MNNKLSNISTQYRKFTKGQYIGPDQFNEFLDFFEDQDRLSRVLLQGVGIVCGLKPKLIYTNGQLSSIQLSQGVALTTDGDLLTLNITSNVSKDLYVSDLKTVSIENESFTHFKAYDNFKIKYPSFYEGDEQIELWELATAQEARSDFQSITKLSNLEDKYLLLYLEDYEKEIKPCRGADCDNHGVLQIRNLKVLVTTAKGIDHILGKEGAITGPVSAKDIIQPHPLFVDGVLAPVESQRVIVSRLIAERGIKNHFSASDLKKLYVDALEKNNYGQAIFEKIQAISQLMGFPTVYTYQVFKDNLEKCLALDAGFQYAYDVIKDLTDTYSEIIKLLPKSFTKCLPDFASFPKHIMLGKLLLDTQLDSSRHQFYNSPVLDDEKATQRLRELVNRFNHQALNFSYSGSKKEIKITSSQKLNPLSNKAIPFYYEVTEGFLKTWSFDKTSNRSFTDNVRYDLAFLPLDPNIQGPVNFSIDKSSFYNIEGHQGMDYQMAFEQIKQIRDEQQLGFDIMALSLEELVHNKDLSKAYFNDYADQNPGLEHRHGVERGGTFLIVYASVKDPKVIADFSLPYICCTPKSVVKLSLPDTVICNKSGHIPFTVFPMNGIVEARVDTKLNGGVEVINGLYFFNPGSVNPELYGQEIGFIVNGKPTDCSIKVIPQPDVKIEIGPVFYPEGVSPATIVNFKVSGQNFADYTYSWDFWDNGSFITLSPDKDGNVSYTYYNLSPTKIPAIKVKISSSGCTQEIIIRDWYKASVKLSLGAIDTICSVSDPIPFVDVFPETGVVKASAGAENSVIISGDGKYSFNPNAVDSTLYGQYIAFTVDGQSTNCRIKVVPPPKVNTTYTVDYPIDSSNDVTINIDVSGDYFTHYTYEWDFLGNNQFTSQQPINGKVSYKYTSLDLKNVPVIGVRVSGGGCNQNTSIRDWYNAPVQLKLPQSVVCSESGSLLFEVSPANGTIVGRVGTIDVGGVVSDGTNYFFDPKLVNPAYHDQLITFTVNGKSTNCSITVINQPNVNIKAVSVDYVAGSPNQTTVNLEASGPGFENYTYAWDFLGTGQFISQNLIGNKMSYTYTNLDLKNIPAISVKVMNGECTQILTITDWYVVIKKIDFTNSVNCCPVSPTDIQANAGEKNMRFSLELGKFVLKGSAVGPLPSEIQYFWSKLSGPNVKLTMDLASGELVVEDLAVGPYVFQLMAKHTKSSAFSIDTTSLTVY